MASLNDSVNMNTDNVGPVVTPNPAPAGTPPINYGSTTTRTTFPQPVPASPDVLGLWNARTSGLPTRGRLLPVSNTVVSSATSSGKAGSPGSPGASGSTGATGTRGSLWYEGAGAPGTITGQMNNDFYLDTSTGNVYELISGVWTFGINITGAAALQVTQVAHGLGSVGSIVPIYFKKVVNQLAIGEGRQRQYSRLGSGGCDRCEHLQRPSNWGCYGVHRPHGG